MDWRTSIQQATPHTAIQRGGLTAWPKGGTRLIGDSLGPVLHFHDDASEIFYFVSGRCRMELGDHEELFEPGDFALVPPLVPHNIWNGGDDDLVFLWLVAPNFVNNKWRTEGIAPDAMHGTVLRGHLEGAGDLPSDSHIASAARILEAGTSVDDCLESGQEALLYCLEGTGFISIDGTQSPLRESTLTYVPSGVAYSIAAESPLRYLELKAPGR